METTSSFHVLDYIVFGLTIFVTLSIGVFHAIANRRRNNTDEYLVGGRSMGFLPTAISLITSFEGSILMLGLPAEVYYFGIQYIWWIVGAVVSQLIAINVVAPLIHPLRITSAYEYLDMRFGSRPVRLLGTVMGILSYMWYMGLVIFGPAVALEAVSGYPVWATMLVTTACAVLYTSIGGIRAVIWTDVFQGFVMLAGIFAVLIQGTVEAGGPKQVWDLAQRAGRMNFFNFNPDPTIRHTFWNLFLGSLFRGFTLIFNQSTIQRVSSTTSVKEAKRMLQFTAPAFLITVSIVLYEGVVVFSYFQTKGCDPLASGQITDPNQLIPFTVMAIFHRLPGMSGLFLAALFSASLSTLSSGLSSTAALAWTDVIEPLVGEISQSRSTIIIKFLVVACGGLACAVSFMVAEIGGTLTQMAIGLISAFGAPLTGIFFLGFLFPRSNAKGAFVGGVVSLTLTVWITMGQSFSPNIPDPVPLALASVDQCFVSSDNASSVDSSFENTTAMFLAPATTTTVAPLPEPRGPSGVEHLYTVSYQYISLIGVLCSIVVGLIVSFITGMNKPGDVDPRCLISVTDSLLGCLPKSARRSLKSIGPQFMDERYKANFESQQEKEIELATGPRIAVVADKPVGETNGKFYEFPQFTVDAETKPSSNGAGVENGGFSSP